MAICASTRLHLSLPSDKSTSAEFKQCGRPIGCKRSLLASDSFKAKNAKGHVRRHVFTCIARSPEQAVEKDQDGSVSSVKEGSDKGSHHALNNGFFSSSSDSYTSEENENHSFSKRIAFNYGFQEKFLRKGATVPGNVFKLAFENFGREWTALRRSYLFAELEKININKIEGGPLGIVSVYLGRGSLLFLRGFDKFLQLYDGLPEIKPEKQCGVL
ncbi:hypothetical protein L7F22_011970 [Adiantum nelumboides]|nr:hypothetical protein [Adiantum nelumboides]